MDINEAIHRTLTVGLIVSVTLLAASLLLGSLHVSRSLQFTVALVGVTVLIATPYTMIAMVILSSTLNRDRGLLTLSILVLIVMVLSLLAGLALRTLSGG